ncbi:DNA-3-methyladenine glycosylase I [Corynebacterium sp. A21]|uniref:DNA-3-methyladenine glycosylase I n=1 Tax=Corynebacterium sp. A21 TaxID=3457318 RepID=UPI003FD3166F
MSELAIGLDGLARTPWATTDPLLQAYYDTEWGMPVRDERGLFERLSLEAFQAGLSWLIILRKRPAFRAAFADFEPAQVAAFTPVEVERLMADAGIVRNRRKIQATINNAAAVLRLREGVGLVDLIWSFQPRCTPTPSSMAEVPTTSKEAADMAKALKKEGFSFVGPTTCFALMEAIGMVDTHVLGSHRRGVSGLWPS